MRFNLPIKEDPLHHRCLSGNWALFADGTGRQPVFPVWRDSAGQIRQRGPGTTIEEQTRLVLDYIGAALRSQGMSFSNVVMSSVYMKDLNEFAAMNEVYAEYFKSEAPARAAVEVARLPRDVKIEIMVIASK